MWMISWELIHFLKVISGKKKKTMKAKRQRTQEEESYTRKSYNKNRLSGSFLSSSYSSGQIFYLTFRPIVNGEICPREWLRKNL